MPVGHVVGDRRVGPAGHDHPHPGRRVGGQQASDAVRVRAGGHAAVLIQPVHHQHQPPARILAGSGGLSQQVQQVRLPGRLGQHRGQVLAGQVGQLLQQHLGERFAGVLGGQPGGDEERHDPHPLTPPRAAGASTNVDMQRRLARPRPGLPPHVRAAIRLKAEPGQLGQLRLPADQARRVRRRDAPDLLQIRRPGSRRTSFRPVSPGRRHNRCARLGADSSRLAPDRRGQLADLRLVGRGAVGVTEVDGQAAGNHGRQGHLTRQYRDQPLPPGRRPGNHSGELLVDPTPPDRLRGHHEHHSIRCS